MKTWNDTILAFTTHISEHFGPVTALIDNLADHLLTKQTAQACPGYFCGTYCTSQPCYQEYHFVAYDYYAYSTYECMVGAHDCSINNCNCVVNH
ncbi:MAG: hypothetical protein H0V70_06375 [Ktedonobacteraceae bacterium]|nr:hypothetical protein [Ktedonobacteraceae bacterium]